MLKAFVSDNVLGIDNKVVDLESGVDTLIVQHAEVKG